MTSSGFSKQARFASFRDPAGRLVTYKNQIFRFIDGTAVADLKSFMASSTASKFLDDRQLVSTRFLSDPESESLFGNGWRQSLSSENPEISVVEHERLPFQSYPYEWPPEMLH